RDNVVFANSRGGLARPDSRTHPSSSQNNIRRARPNLLLCFSLRGQVTDVSLKRSRSTSGDNRAVTENQNEPTPTRAYTGGPRGRRCFGRFRGTVPSTPRRRSRPRTPHGPVGS